MVHGKGGPLTRSDQDDKVRPFAFGREQLNCCKQPVVHGRATSTHGRHSLIHQPCLLQLAGGSGGGGGSGGAAAPGGQPHLAGKEEGWCSLRLTPQWLQWTLSTARTGCRCCAHFNVAHHPAGSSKQQHQNAAVAHLLCRMLHFHRRSRAAATPLSWRRCARSRSSYRCEGVGENGALSWASWCVL